MSQARTKFILTASVVLITIVAAAYWIYTKDIISTDDAQVNSHVYYISPKIGGLIKSVYVDNFYHVKKNQLLAEIDPIDYRNELKSLQYRYTATKDSIGSLEQKSTSIKVNSVARIDSLRSEIYADRALLESDQVDLKKAELDLKRYKNLYQRKAVSQNQLEVANLKYHSALAKIKAEGKTIQSLQSQIAGVQSYQNQMAEIRKQIESQQNQLKSLKNRINIARNNLQHTRLTAPVDGVVTAKKIEPGQYVQPGQTLLMVVPLRAAWVDANFKETLIHRIRVGDKAIIHVDAYPGVAFKGYVKDLDAGTGDRFSLLPPQNASGNYIKIVQRVPVRIQLYPYDYKKYALRVGLNCEVDIKDPKN